MSDSYKIDKIIDDCIDRIRSGETIDDCLHVYPHYQDVLTSLLPSIISLNDSTNAIKPDQKVKTQGLIHLQKEVDSRFQNKVFWNLKKWHPRFTKVALASLTVLILIPGLFLGADRASASSVPGEPVYWIKKSKENISLMIPRSDTGRAQRHAQIAKNRAQEARRLVQLGKLSEAENHSGKIRSHLSISAQLVGINFSTSPVEMPPRKIKINNRKQLAQFRTVLIKDFKSNKEILLHRISSLTPEKQAILRQMARRQELNYRLIIAVLENSSSAQYYPFWITEPPRRKSGHFRITRQP